MEHFVILTTAILYILIFPLHFYITILTGNADHGIKINAIKVFFPSRILTGYLDFPVSGGPRVIAKGQLI